MHLRVMQRVSQPLEISANIASDWAHWSVAHMVEVENGKDDIRS